MTGTAWILLSHKGKRDKLYEMEYVSASQRTQSED